MARLDGASYSRAGPVAFASHPQKQITERTYEFGSNACFDQLINILIPNNYLSHFLEEKCHAEPGTEVLIYFKNMLLFVLIMANYLSANNILVNKNTIFVCLFNKCLQPEGLCTSDQPCLLLKLRAQMVFVSQYSECQGSATNCISCIVTGTLCLSSISQFFVSKFKMNH